MDGLVERFNNQQSQDQETLFALYPFSYKQNGQNISFETGDWFVLLDKSNKDWWHVRQLKDNSTLYVPSSYVCLSGQATDVGEEESTGSLSSQGETNTLSPSSESSFPDCDDGSEKDQAISSDENTNLNSPGNELNSESVYANIPVGVKRELSKTRHHSSGTLLERPRPKSATLPPGWVVHIDDNSGRSYYVNTNTRETSWKPPRARSPLNSQCEDEKPRHSFSGSLPRGWRLERQEAVEQYLYVNEKNNEMWQSSKDDEGRTYYYSIDGDKTSWELPALNDPDSLQVPDNDGRRIITRHRMSSEGSEHVVNLRTKSPQLQQRASKSISVSSGFGVLSNGNSNEMSSFFKGHQRTPSDGQTRNSLILADEFPPPTVLPDLNYSTKKEGTVNRRKLCEQGGKRIKKPSWSPCYIKLSSTNMIMYKNHSAAAPKPSFPHGRPESSCDLRGAVIEKMPDEGKRRNIFQVATISKLCFLIQLDNVQEFSDWFHMISDVVTLLQKNDPVEPGMEAQLFVDNTVTAPLSSRPSLKKIREGDKKNIKDKLKKLMTRRPTMEELQKKGILKDITFGCHIAKLCAREKTDIPKVVTDCIEAIEQKGLDFDGLYRVSGNVSAIQQLRIAVDQEDRRVHIGERPFDDVHVLTGTLKLYFRELPEPLFPHNQYDDFVEAIKMSTKKQKTKNLKLQIQNLPSPNAETLRYLFKHLRRVMEHSQSNRMHAHNLAIVFGPTLLAPEEEHGNIAINTVYQNQIVEYILLEYDNIL